MVKLPDVMMPPEFARASDIPVGPPPPTMGFTNVQVAFLANRTGTLDAILNVLAPQQQQQKQESEKEKPEEQQQKQQQITPEEALRRLNELVEIGQIVGDVGAWYSARKLVSAVRPYLLSRVCAVRVAALRVLTAFAKRRAFVQEMAALGVGYLVAHSLERDPSACDAAGAERLDALRWVCACVAAAPADVARPETAALVAVVNSVRRPKATPFYGQCMYTLCRLAIVNPRVVWQCRGMKAIFAGVLNPAYQALLGTFVATATFLLDDDTTRKYVRLEEEFAAVFQPLLGFIKLDQTPAPASLQGLGVPKQLATPEAIENWQYQCDAALRFLAAFLQSWTGVVVMASNRMFVPLVRALRLPQPDLHDRVLDTIFAALRAPVPTGASNPFVAARGTAQTPAAKESFRHTPVPPALKRHHNVVDHVTALVLMGLLNAGLVEALVEMVKRPCSPRGFQQQQQQQHQQQKQPSQQQQQQQQRLDTTTKAVVLLGELHFLSNRLLPPTHCVRFEQLPTLMEAATAFGSPELRSRACTAVMNLHSYSKLRAEGQGALSRTPQHFSARDYRLERIDEVKLQLDWSISEARLLERIQATRVPSSKDYANTWQWSLIVDVLEGSLSNPANTELAIRSKFYPRLMTFFKPKEKQFARMRWADVRQAHVRSGTVMLRNLVRSEAGMQFLTEEKLLAQVADALRQELAVIKEEHDAKTVRTGDADGDGSSSRLFSRSSFATTAAREYLMIVGQLTSSDNGIELLRRSRVLEYLNALTEFPAREDLNYAVLKSLDYRTSVDAREMLKAFMLSPSKFIRTVAIRYVRVLLRLSDKTTAGAWAAWAIPLLAACFHDSETLVRQEAFSIWQEACESFKVCTDAAVRTLPNPDEEALRFRDGQELLLRYLSRPKGLALLAKKGFVDKELARWLDSANVTYLEELEAALAQLPVGTTTAASAASATMTTSAITMSSVGAGGASDVGSSAVVVMKPHLFGELAKSPEGRELLRQRDVVPTLIARVTNPHVPAVQQRAALLALGHIAQCRKAFPLLERSGALTLVRTIAETSPSMSLRGTAFLVLGMFCHSRDAAATLAHQGWLALTTTDTDFGIAVPAVLFAPAQHPFFTIPPLPYHFPPCTCPALTPGTPHTLTPDQRRLFASIEELLNPIVAETASTLLAQVLATQPHLFHAPALAVAVLELLENYQMPSYTRRFIYNLLFGSLPASHDNTPFFSTLDSLHLPPSLPPVDILPPPLPPIS